MSVDFNALVQSGKKPVIQVGTVELKIVQGYGLPKFPGDESHSKQWVENCPSGCGPMDKLEPVKKGIFLPDVTSIGFGECQSDRNVKAKIEQWISEMAKTPELVKAFHYQPAWYCPQCRSLWGEVSMYWSRFRPVDEVLNQEASNVLV